MNNYILTVTLNPAVDKTVRVRKLLPEKEGRFSGGRLSAGGKGINVSRALKELGIPTLATGFCGGPSGKLIRAALDREKIPHDFIAISGETRTNVTIRETSTGRLRRVLQKGPSVTRQELEKFRRSFRPLARRAAAVVFSGRNVGGAGEGFYAELIRLARRLGKKTALDTSGRPLAAGLKAKPYLVKPNRAEAEFVMGKKLRTPRALRKALEYFGKQGISVVLISLGREGAVASNGREFWRVVPPRVKAVNTVGCGDALVAGFLYAESRGLSFCETLRTAVAVGTTNALSLTPGHLRRSDIARISRGIKIKAL